MGRAFRRRTIYAATAIVVLMLAGTWTFAAVLITQNPPAQNSSITVVNPNGVTFAKVQSTEMVAVTSTIAGLPAAGVPAGSGGALNSTIQNVLLPYCGGGTCPPYDNNFSAVGATNALTLGDEAVQVSLFVTQSVTPANPNGFDVQVELILWPTGCSSNSCASYVFGDGYFDTGTAATASTVWTVLFVDTGYTAISPADLENVVITINQCITATTCP